MPNEVEVLEYYDEINKVVSLMLQGQQPMEIARTLGMKRKDVVACIEDWQKMARNNNQIQERAKDAITGADQHYSMVINKLWETVDQAETLGDLRIKKDSLATIATVEQKRIDMLQKAGLLDNQELAAQVAENERKQKLLTEILREVATEHPEIRHKILTKLAKVTGEPEGVVIENE